MEAVLFDLDGTLLDIDIDAFMDRYLGALSDYTVSLYPEGDVMPAVMAGVRAMMVPHPGSTNEQAFFDGFEQASGIDIADDWDVFDTFYREHFDGLRGEAAPRVGALEALDAAREAGARVVVATNPMFPAIAIEKRMRWAGIDGRPIDLVTTYETSIACKPHGDYYLQIARELEVAPERCLMVGDDAHLDMSASQVGMETFYVGSGTCATADHQGSMWDVRDLLRSRIGTR